MKWKMNCILFHIALHEPECTEFCNHLDIDVEELNSLDNIDLEAFGFFSLQICILPHSRDSFPLISDI